jgi:hypothetical protein
MVFSVSLSADCDAFAMKAPENHPMTVNWTMHAWRAAALVAVYFAGSTAQSAPVVLLRTEGYESPVRADPDDLVLLAGTGFERTDLVVYEAMDAADGGGGHPLAVPAKSTAQRGIAPLVHLGDPPYTLTVRLPDVVQPRKTYRLWVINAKGEWSDAVLINDPRPQWITPSYAYSTADLGGLGRHIRIVGRNLEPAAGSMLIRLAGPAEYRLESTAAAGSAALHGELATSSAGQQPTLSHYIAEAPLPARLRPGSYAVSVSRDGLSWSRLPDQHLEVRADPAPLTRFALTDPDMGGCRPDDGEDDGACLARAIKAAQQRGGIVFFPAGRWDLFPAKTSGESSGNGFVLPRGVHLLGAGSHSSFILRHGARDAPAPGALFTLTGNNSVVALAFADDDRYTSARESRTVIQLGLPAPRNTPADGPGSEAVEDIVISDNLFRHVGRAVVDSGRPIERLFITKNDFGAYDNALLLIGSRSNVARPFRVADSVFRDNKFVPGSYIDVSARQGAIASQIGASSRVDFSSNVADGQSVEALQDADDPHGWRAGFFWNANGSHERLLVADNRIICPGDKAGDGEAIAFDGNGNTLGFNGAQSVQASGTDWISVRAPLLAEQNGHPINTATYYEGHWVQVVAGLGIGQTRKIVSYVTTSGTVTLRVAPRWDVVPVSGTRVIVGQQFWQVYAVANQIEQRSPQCRKANLSGPRGGLISLWAPSADSTVEGNWQADTDGIVIQQAYGAKAASCPDCGNGASFHTALEIRSNTIEGEYDWDSDCSNSGIMGSFAASPTPESPPPVLGFGISISHNVISHADGLRGGAIDIASVWFRGPPPHDWPLVENMMIAHNRVQNVGGSLPRNACHFPQRRRTGIRVEGTGNVRDTILYANRCEQVDVPLEDSGHQTVRVCSQGSPGDCECSAQ